MIQAFISELYFDEMRSFCADRGFGIFLGNPVSGRWECTIMPILWQMPADREKQVCFEIGYRLAQLQEKTQYAGIIDYINQWIPPFIEVNGKMYLFKMFNNHAHYDFRVCYDAGNDDRGFGDFLFLFENIDSDSDLLDTLKQLRQELKNQNLLDGDYATDEGYTKEKYLQWYNEQTQSGLNQ